MKKIENLYIINSWPWKTIKGLSLMGLILFLGGCGSPTDTTPPSTITDIQHVSKTRGTINWTAPGDDGNDGTASSYDVRISEQAINNDSEFIDADEVLNVPSPSVAGTLEELTIPELDIGTTYFVAIKTSDSDGNQSGLSTSFPFASTTENISRGGLNSSDTFGKEVANLDDVTGDGVPDIGVGAPFKNATTGTVYIFPGGIDLLDTTDPGVIILNGQQPGDEFGSAIAGVGDVNNDGCNDFIVGANKFIGSNFTNSNGAAYIFYGSGAFPCPSVINLLPDVTILGVNDGDEFGTSVSSAGDLDGDNISDFLIGAPFYDGVRGRTYLFLGGSLGPNMDGTDAILTLTGEAPGDRFGFSMDSNGDIDGDGTPDITIGAYQTSSLNEGMVYTFWGSTLNNKISSGGGGDLIAGNADVIFSGVMINEQNGWSLAITGDMNGDALSDLVIGTRFPNQGAGAVYIFYSGLGFSDKTTEFADVTLDGSAVGDRFGWSVADAGDVDLDGFTDLIVGARDAILPSTGERKGMAYLFYGGPNLTNSNASFADFIFKGEGNLDGFGNSVAGIGDTNGDGYDEFIVGAPFNDNSAMQDNGAAYIYR